MRALDYILLAVIALCAFFAFRTWRKALKSGDCCGHGGCNGDCAHCQFQTKELLIRTAPSLLLICF